MELNVRVFNPNKNPINVGLVMEGHSSWLKSESLMLQPGSHRLARLEIKPDKEGSFMERLIVVSSSNNIAAEAAVMLNIVANKSANPLIGLSTSASIIALGLVMLWGYRRVQA